MLKTSCLLKRLNGNLLCTCRRLQNTTANETQSFRQRAWEASRQRYANYEHVHFSSFLEYKFMSLKKINPKNPTNYPPLDVVLEIERQMKPDDVSYPYNWMEDYEFYAGGNETGIIDSKHGTPDATVVPSTVPCNGCGAHLHCANSSMPGYIPSEIFKGRTTRELQSITCQRCHFLKHYNIALDVEVPPSAYVETISRIQDKFALAVIIVDLLDLPSSIWPGMQQVLGSKRPVFLVGNKVDLLPRDSNGYLSHVKHCLKQQFIQHGGFDALNIKNVSLISAKTGYGIEELITQLHKIWQYKGDVYLLGCTNVGKSTLFNILLNSDYCRPEASELVHKATTCAWPGTTLQMLKFPIFRPSDMRVYQRFKRLFSERSQRAALDKLRRDQAKETGATTAAQLIGHVGRTFDHRMDVDDAFAMPAGTQPITTLNDRKLEYREARWVYDTPGVMQPDQITPMLTTEELLLLQPTKMLKPRALRLAPNMSLFLGGLARIDLLQCSRDWVKLFIFAVESLPLLITETQQAEQVYKRYLGTPLLGVPIAGRDEKRLQRWSGLQCLKQDIVVQSSKTLTAQGRPEKQLNCDITLSSAGWIGLLLPDNSESVWRIWTPQAAGIYVREPSLIPLADRLVGKRIRNSLAYNTAKPFVFQK
ncbi:hypothetical protein ACLKA7_014057 [Drosophila subpalustris]